MESRYFDLNIEKVLDNWEIHHAIREIIANALDETVLTGCRQPDIFKDSADYWHIHDYGRGLNYEHFTQNQNAEKLNADNIIGKFGVGLKDALAVLNRAQRSVAIDSKYGHITLVMHAKDGFNDVKTLHAMFDAPLNTDFEGTEFTLEVSDEEIKKAKKLFLYFENKTPLDSTTYGEIYERDADNANIYVNGVKVADEENYTFDYNITKQNAALKKALNRERSFLGRTAYSTTVKNMLLSSDALDVIAVLLNELKKIPLGTQRDEINYLDVQVYAVKKYNALKPTVFMSSLDAYDLSDDDKEKIFQSGRELVVIPDNVFDHVKDDQDENGEKIGTFAVVQQEYSDSFEYHFVKASQLSAQQQAVWQIRIPILKYLGKENYQERILISTTINEYLSGDSLGVWDGSNIVIKQTVLQNKEMFANVLIHELVHASTGYSDNSRNFENALGEVIGQMAVGIIDSSMSTQPVAEQSSKPGFFKRLFR